MTDAIVTEIISAGDVKIGDYLRVGGEFREVLHMSSRPVDCRGADYPITFYMAGEALLAVSGQAAERLTGASLREQMIRTEDGELSDN